MFLSGGFGIGMAFKHLRVAQESIELHIHNSEMERTKMGMKPRKNPVATRNKTPYEKDRAARQKKNGGKLLDKKTHKLVVGKKSACGKPMGEWEAGVFSGGVEGRDSWHFVDCKDCLAVMPPIVHSVNFHPVGMFGAMEAHDDCPARWKAESTCGKRGVTPAETTTDDHASVSCMECLSKLAPMYRRHFIRTGGSQKSTLCGAKTNSQNEYSTDSWWLCTCPDCYRVSEAPTVHPMQEEDCKLLLHNSIIAARNQGFVPTQGWCAFCSEKSSTRAGSRCLACSILSQRDSSPVKGIEDEMVRILGLPYEWVMDLLKGWDGDKGCELTYATAYKLGTQLWRKHGENTAA